MKEWEEQAIGVIESLATQMGCLTMLLDKENPLLKEVRRTSDQLAVAALGFTAEARARVAKGERL